MFETNFQPVAYDITYVGALILSTISNLANCNQSLFISDAFVT
nr:MAG TPA: hypothetical protein [Caudoviricetes sp.]